MTDETQNPGRAPAISGNLDASGLRLAIVAARFNGFLVDPLVTGALDAVERHGGEASSVKVVRVPGAFEIPLIARKLASGGGFDAIICLGAVIRGATPHFDFVAGQAARGIARAAEDTGVPCAFGVVTTDTLEQAIERCGAKMGNKGYDAAVTAIEMANLLRKL